MMLRQCSHVLAGYDWAVTEFARVTGTLSSTALWRRLSPELLRGRDRRRYPSEGSAVWLGPG